MIMFKVVGMSVSGAVFLGFSLLQGWTLLALVLVIVAAVVVGIAVVHLKQQVDELAIKTGALTKTVDGLADTVADMKSTFVK